MVSSTELQTNKYIIIIIIIANIYNYDTEFISHKCELWDIIMKKKFELWDINMLCVYMYTHTHTHNLLSIICINMVFILANIYLELQPHN